MTWCSQCQEAVGYHEQLVDTDPHGIEYHELTCEQCGASLALMAVEVEPSEPQPRGSGKA